MNAIVEEIKKLSVFERIQLVQDIWNSIPNFASELSAEEQNELHRRYVAHQADPSTGVQWEQIRAKIFSEQQH